jgi:hypothetical protein
MAVFLSCGELCARLGRRRLLGPESAKETGAVPGIAKKQLDTAQVKYGFVSGYPAGLGLKDSKAKSSPWHFFVLQTCGGVSAGVI